MDAGFAVILIAALVLNVLLSIMQHRVYMSATRRLQANYLGQRNHFLVSGRGKGFLRGAIVLLVIDASRNEVVAAEAMLGSTVFTRFKPRPELLGPVPATVSRASDDRMLRAVEHAMEQYRVTRRSGTTNKLTTN